MRGLDADDEPAFGLAVCKLVSRTHPCPITVHGTDAAYPCPAASGHLTMLLSAPVGRVCRDYLVDRGLRWYLAALLVMIAGSMLAARHFPGGFDWHYTVASALASQKHNPGGNAWFAGGLSLAMLLLWPYVSAIHKRLGPAHAAGVTAAIIALRTGIVCGALLGTERLLIRDLSAWVYKAHEILGILTFFGLYFGILALLVLAMLRQRRFALPLVLIASPLLATSLTQFWLYVAQRDLGWVDTGWREMGIPVWLSFAFWQWLAIGFLWFGLALLALIVRKSD